MDSPFDSFLPSPFDDFLATADTVFDRYLEQKITEPPALTIHDKLRMHLEKSRAHAEITRQNFTASRLPQGLRLGYN